MKYLIQLWQFFDGMKTNLGAMLLTISVILTNVIVGIWHYNPSFMPATIETINWFGGALTTTGLTHKVIKAATNTQLPVNK